MKKHFLIAICIAALLLLLVACAPDNLEKNALGYVVENYSLEEVLSEYEMNDKDFYQNFKKYLYLYDDYPIMMQVLDDMMDAEYYEGVDILADLADKSGYYPSGVLGKYFYDKETKYIHCTNSACFENVPRENMVFPCFLSSEELKREISDEDQYLKDAVLCPQCCSEIQ